MKKIVLVLISLFIFAGIQAQDITRNTGVLRTDQSLLDYTGTYNDIVSGSTSNDTLAVKVRQASHSPVVYNARIKVDTIGSPGANALDIKLQGKVYSTDSWSDVSSTTISDISGGVSEQTFASNLSSAVDTLDLSSNHVAYRFWRVIIDGNSLATDDEVELQYVYLKFYNR